jgi:hypothetical protein
MDKNSSSRPLPPEVVVDGHGVAWREVEAVVDSDDDIWEDKLLLVLGAVAKDVFFFCRTLAMVASVVSGECAYYFVWRRHGGGVFSSQHRTMPL